MRNLNDLTVAELRDVVLRIQTVLYGLVHVDADDKLQLQLDHNKVWDAGTIEEVDQALVDADLSPALHEETTDE